VFRCLGPTFAFQAIDEKVRGADSRALLDSVAIRTYNLSYKTPSSSGTQRSTA
jgi:hypothetical protein